MKVAVIIPYYRGTATISECLANLAGCRKDFQEVFIVDNCDRNSLPADIALRYPELPLQVLRTKPRIGFGRACNVGIARALECEYEAVVLLNQDARVAPDCLRTLIAGLGSEVVATFPISLKHDLKTISPQYVEYYISRNTTLVADLVLGELKPAYRIPHNGANAACVAIHIARLGRDSFFEPEFPMYGEDIELFYRAVQAGHGLDLLPKARIGHVHSNLSKLGNAKIEINISIRRGHQVFKLKHAHRSKSLSALKCLKHTLGTYLSRWNQPKILLEYLVWDLELLVRLPTILNHREIGRMQQAAMDYVSGDLVAEQNNAVLKRTG